eukprot:COSAG04_NODE_26082_length_299_cov_1.370000_1_plen_71_part_01
MLLVSGGEIRSQRPDIVHILSKRPDIRRALYFIQRLLLCVLLERAVPLWWIMLFMSSWTVSIGLEPHLQQL